MGMRANPAGGKVARHRGAQALEGTLDAAVLDGRGDALPDALVRGHVPRGLFRLDDLALPLRLVEVDGGLEHGPRRQRRPLFDTTRTLALQTT